MFKKIWRYSHLSLAVFSFLFLLLASITGIILAFEPIQTQIKYSPNSALDEVYISELIPKLKTEYDEIFELKRSEDDLISVSALSIEKDIDGEFLIDVKTGNTVAKVPKQSGFFKFITKLHRSLFLKNTGRWIIGLNAIFLTLIVCSGIVLIAKRQQGWTHFFKKVAQLDFASYSHTVLGRWALLPILILSASAVILFLIRFEYLPKSEPKLVTFEVDASLKEKELFDFDVFKTYSLADIKSIEFPFSEEPEDYYILNLNHKTISIHQYTGQILEEVSLDNNTQWYDLNLFLHTGKGSIGWAVILGLSAIAILYFIFSGMQMAWPRLKRKAKNKFKPENTKIVVLYGSETGSTKYFSTLFFKALINAKQKAYITTLNNYQEFPKMEKLVIFTSTYGKGEAPHNAFYFHEKWREFKNTQEVEFSVIGFGSTHYPDFCSFAQEVNLKLNAKENFKETLALKKIDNRSVPQLKSWWNNWNEKTKINTHIPDKLTQKLKLNSFKIISKETIKDGFGTTFMLHIQSKNNLLFESGDLLGVFPPQEHIERYYSIGKKNKNEILLSVKLHDKGICSNYLNSLNVGETFKAFIKNNAAFHLPKHAKSITFISNGTGIAPYLGMVQQFKGEKYFYWGGRKEKSWELYKNYIQPSGFKEFELVYSREESDLNYIQDIIKTRQEQIFNRLQEGGIIMFCGSMQMQEDVMEILDIYAHKMNYLSMENWVEKGQIKIDTY